MQQPWMSVVVPAYNEELAIGATLAALREWLDAAGRPYEIVVVDNASQDGTATSCATCAGRARAAADQRREPGQGLLRPPGMLETTGGAAAHVRRRLRAQPRLARPDGRGQPRGARRGGLAPGGGGGGGARPALSAPSRRLALHRADPPPDGGAHARRLLRLQAVARRGGRRGASRSRRSRAGPSTPRCWRCRPAPRLQRPRGGDRLGRPRRLAPVDPRGPAAGGGRAAGRPPQRPPPGRETGRRRSTPSRRPPEAAPGRATARPCPRERQPPVLPARTTPGAPRSGPRCWRSSRSASLIRVLYTLLEAPWPRRRAGRPVLLQRAAAAARRRRGLRQPVPVRAPGRGRRCRRPSIRLCTRSCWRAWPSSAGGPPTSSA